MLIDDSWNSLLQEKGSRAISLADKYIRKLFDFYFAMKGFSIIESGDAVDRDRAGSLYYGSHSGAFHCEYTYKNASDYETLYLLRYYNYPDIDDDYFVAAWMPGPFCLLGFAERLMYSLEYHILPAIYVRGADYNRMLADSRSKRKYEREHFEPFTGEKIRIIEENNRQKGFCSKYLSYENTKKQDIKRSILRMLASGRQEN